MQTTFRRSIRISVTFTPPDSAMGPPVTWKFNHLRNDSKHGCTLQQYVQHAICTICKMGRSPGGGDQGPLGPALARQLAISVGK